MTKPNKFQLRQFIVLRFSDDELDDLCLSNEQFDKVRLGQFSDGMGMRDKALALLDYCDRHSLMDDLLQTLKTLREKEYLNTFLSEPETAVPKSASAPPSPAPLPPNVDDLMKGEVVKKSSPEPSTENTPQTDMPLEDLFFDELTGLEFLRIPAGEFIFGEEGDETILNLPEFWISRTPVTNESYQRFIDDNPDYRVPKTFLGGDHNWDKRDRDFAEWRAEHPVTLVNVDDAVAFCKWADVSLPTEEQWEKAARGTDGRLFPWGNEAPTKDLCNYSHNEGDTTPVGAYSPQGDSPYGCVDMSGNVYEWCMDSIGGAPARRGGAWDATEEWARLTCYYLMDVDPALRVNDLGFRVVLMGSPYD